LLHSSSGSPRRNRRRLNRKLVAVLNPGLILLGGKVGSHPISLSFVTKDLEHSEFAMLCQELRDKIIYLTNVRF